MCVTKQRCDVITTCSDVLSKKASAMRFARLTSPTDRMRFATAAGAAARRGEIRQWPSLSFQRWGRCQWIWNFPSERGRCIRGATDHRRACIPGALSCRPAGGHWGPPLRSQTERRRRRCRRPTLLAAATTGAGPRGGTAQGRRGSRERCPFSTTLWQGVCVWKLTLPHQFVIPECQRPALPHPRGRQAASPSQVRRAAGPA